MSDPKSAVEKRLARSVLAGFGVTFTTASGSITGWIIGWDKFHWIVLTERGTEFMLHKGNVSMLAITDFAAIEEMSDDAFTLYEGAVGPFRKYLIDNKYAPSHLLEATPC